MSSAWRSPFKFFFFSSRRRHTRFDCDWSSDVCSSDLIQPLVPAVQLLVVGTLEAGAAETEGLQVVAGGSPDHAGRDVGGVGNVLGAGALPFQRLLAPRAQHGAALRP